MAFSTAEDVEIDVAESAATEGSEPDDAVTEPEPTPDEPGPVDAAGQPRLSSELRVAVVFASVTSSLLSWVCAAVS